MAEARAQNESPQVEVSDDLAIPLEDSAVWFRLKELVSHAILSLPDGDEKRVFLRFMRRHWPGHAPRSAEVATMTSKMTLLQREKDRLLALLRLPTAKR